MTIVVNARNRLPWWVIVPIGGPPYNAFHKDVPTSTGQGFALFVEHADGTPTHVATTTFGQSAVRFAPFWTWHFTTTVHLDSTPTLWRPGKYRVVSGFGKHMADTVVFEVRK